MKSLAEERIDELEITLAHQNRTLEELSETVADQWRMIEDLQRKLNLLTHRFGELEEPAETPAESKPPPHW